MTRPTLLFLRLVLLVIFCSISGNGQTLKLITINHEGDGTGNVESISPSITISADGRYIAFASSASDLTSIKDENNSPDIFIRDIRTGITTMVSVNQDGSAAGNGGCFVPSITPDGRYVVFASTADDLTDNINKNSGSNIFVRDLMNRTTRLVSINKEGLSGNGNSLNPSISADGRFVAFVSTATDLVSISDINNFTDVFLRDLQNNTTRLISINRSGTGSGNRSSAFNRESGTETPIISLDGRKVMFISEATDLVALSDKNNDTDIFVRDLQSDATELVSINQKNDGSGRFGANRAVMSADGRFIAYVSTADDLIETDNNTATDIFARDLARAKTLLISAAQDGRSSGVNSFNPSISDDGRFIAFTSLAERIVDNDLNGESDIFVRDSILEITTLVSVASSGNSGNQKSFQPLISGNGKFVVFQSKATNLVTVSDNPDTTDIFLRDLMLQQTALASFSEASNTTGNNISYFPAINKNGQVVAFNSDASDLIENDQNNGTDIFALSFLPNTLPPPEITRAIYKSGQLTIEGRDIDKTAVFFVDDRLLTSRFKKGKFLIKVTLTAGRHRVRLRNDDGQTNEFSFTIE